MTVRIIHGDARQTPLDDSSVDLIITSPPYWSLRSYTDGGEHYDGQIGAEPTPAAYIDNLIDCTREWMRVLKPTGSLWVNLGDKYNSAARGQNGTASTSLAGGRHDRMGGRGATTRGIPNKSLMGLPWRYALRCIDDLGLILRAEVIWSKPNGLPESVTDRVRRSHEHWFHLVKQPRYYSAIDHIRQEYSGRVQERQQYAGRDIPRRKWSTESGRNDSNGERGILGFGHRGANPLGALPGSVWEIATEPLRVPAHIGIDHFAAYPTALIKPIILGWSPAGICTTCGEGRRPVVDRQRRNTRPLLADAAHFMAHNGDERRAYSRGETDVTITGEVCGCPDTSAPTRPAVVLDPFAGTGTTLLVAKALGRDAVGVDMSADYCRLAEWRTSDPGQLAKAMGVPKPPKELDGQASALDLLTELDGGAA